MKRFNDLEIIYDKQVVILIGKDKKGFNRYYKAIRNKKKITKRKLISKELAEYIMI